MIRELRNKWIRPVMQQLELQAGRMEQLEQHQRNIQEMQRLMLDRINHLADTGKNPSEDSASELERNHTEAQIPPPPRDAARTLSNDELCISLIDNGRNKTFFWVSYAQANDNVSETAHRAQGWFPAELYAICENENRYFLDIGANIGGVSLYLASFGWRGVCIEASEKNCTVLRKSIELNGFDLGIQEVGVWKENGSIYFHQLGPFGYICTEPEDGAEEIRVTALDGLQAELADRLPQLDFIKMDIEGSEVAALEGMGKLLQHYRYPPMFVEANPWTLSLVCQHTVMDMVKQAEAYGYQTYRMHEGQWKRFDSSYFIDSVCTDLLFVHPARKEPLFPLSGSSYPKRKAKENIALVKDVLGRYLIRQTGEDQIFEWTVAICNSLRDFQNLRTEEVNALLTKVYELSEGSYPLVIKALSWFKESTSNRTV